MTASRRVHGAGRILRGALAAHLAVGSAALAHTAAGHHGPHPVVILLALAISVPLCSAFCSVRLSRGRLAAAVVLSQAVLHGLFSLFPASYGMAPAGIAEPHTHGLHGEDLPEGPDGHGAHASAEALGVHSVSSGSSGHDGAMLAAHLFAAAATYLLLRRGELLLEVVAEAVALRAFLLLLQLPQPLPDRRRVRPAPAPSWTLRLWPGSGPRTVRGPPLVMA